MWRRRPRTSNLRKSMFESDLEKEPGTIRRRGFLIASVSALGGVMLWSLRRPHVLEVSASASKETPSEVTIVEFSDDGKKLKTAKVPKVIKAEEEWKKQLSPNAFDITRHADTEFAFS